MKPLTEKQKQKLHFVEDSIEKAIERNDLVLAGDLLEEIQSMLIKAKHNMRLIQIKNNLYEAHINAGNYNRALEGLLEVRRQVNQETRTFLEISVLLAICYIRLDNIEMAEPIIKGVLTNDKVIKVQTRRVEFKKIVIERFNEEGILFSMKDSAKVPLTIEEVDKEVSKVVHLSEEEVYSTIGQSLPASAMNILARIDGYSKKQLPYVERKLLGAPIAQTDTKEAGKTLFSCVKRVLYKSLCDPKSEIYQAWFNNGLKLVLEKKFIVGAVVSVLTGFGIGIKAIAASIVALVIKFGIEIFCEQYKPSGIMALR